jgi:Phytochelatin synthase
MSSRFSALLLSALLRTAAAVNVPFNSPLGTSMLTSSATLASGFYALAPGWTPQSTLSYHASLATTATILNALGAAPPDPATGFSWATQADLFGSACVRSLGTHSGSVFSAAWLAANGVTLDEWAAYVRCFASVQQTHANMATPDTFRAALTAALGASSWRRTISARSWGRVAAGTCRRWARMRRGTMRCWSWMCSPGEALAGSGCR